MGYLFGFPPAAGVSRVHPRCRNAVRAAALAAGLLVTCHGQAALIDQGDVIYDDALNLYWLKDANAAQTSGFDGDGAMTFAQATAWIDSLNTASYLGFNDWRLPGALPVNGVAYDDTLSFDGSTDGGYNISAPGSAFAGTTASEMAYLYYNSLGNDGYYDLTGTPTGCAGVSPFCLTQTDNFANVQASFYWSGDAFTGTATWGFRFQDGQQTAGSNTITGFAWAVRDGMTVPVPAAGWLLGSGLLGLFGAGIRRRDR